MKYSREKLIELAKPYFTQDIEMMHATEDGHFFHKGSLNYAKDHAAPLGLVIEDIFLEDIKPSKKQVVVKPEKVEDENSKAELIEEAKKLGLKVDGRMNEETIKNLIKGQ